MSPDQFPVLVDDDAEKAVIGCAFHGIDWTLVGALRPEDFGNPKRAKVWEAMTRLARGGKPVDHLTVAEQLRGMGHLADVGGPQKLMLYDQVPPVVANLPAYVATVQALSEKRRIQALCHKLLAAAHDPNLTPAQLLGRAQAGFMGLSVSSEVDESGDRDVWELVDRWQSFVASNGANLPFFPHGVTGLRPTLVNGQLEPDCITPGYPMSLSVVGGQSGVGKTTFAASEIIHLFMTLGLPGGIVGLEDGTEWLAARLLGRAVGVPFGRVGACRLSPWQESKLEDWCRKVPQLMREKLRTWPKPIDSPGLIAKVEQWKQWGARWVWVDHGLRVKYGRDNRQRLDLQIEEFTQQLAELARPKRNDPGMAIICNWHVNRDNENETIPDKKQFKEAGYLDSNARYMLGVWKRQRSPDARLITCVKANKGPEGWTVEAPLDAPAGLFRDDGGRVLDFEQERRGAQEAKSGPGRRAQMFGARSVP